MTNIGKYSPSWLDNCLLALLAVGHQWNEAKCSAHGLTKLELDEARRYIARAGVIVKKVEHDRVCREIWLAGDNGKVPWEDKLPDELHRPYNGPQVDDEIPF